VDRAEVTRATAAARSWWFRPEPLARLAVLRVLVYLYVPVDLFTRTAQVVPASYGSSGLYKPVNLLVLIHQPMPKPWFTQSLRALVVVASLVAATGMFRIVAGWIAALAYLDWCCLAMSFGEVGHDHFVILVAVFVLFTAEGARWRSTASSPAAGWALKCIEVASIATYFLAAYAKVRFAGWHWVNGAVFAWAIVRRGTALSHPLLHHPTALLVSQWALFALEVATPVLLFVRQRWRTFGFVVLLAFHITTWLTIGINFAPLVVCLTAFLPLERVAAFSVQHADHGFLREGRHQPAVE
jgi:hypothetical protein